MRKRLEKKREKRIRKDIHKALDMVLDINGIGRRTQGSTGNLPTAFFNFSGHTAGIYADIHKNGWTPDGPFPETRYCYLEAQTGYQIDEFLSWLEGMKKELGC